MSFSGEKILLIGGSGSLGNAFIRKHLEKNDIYVYSRDECKHWAMTLVYANNPNLHFIIGNISNKEKITQTLLRYNFSIVINAAALKHIDRCEYESNECISTNLIGSQNLLNAIEEHRGQLTRLSCCCFISTDKACSPVNLYGMCKAASETLYIEKSRYIEDIKFVCVRYGNVLNSRGSIIPTLHEYGRNDNVHAFKLTDERMTRFIMTLEQSVNLIEHAVTKGETGDVVLPELISCNVKDLIEIFSERYNKPIEKMRLRPGEKLLESLVNHTQSLRLVKDNDSSYMYIRAPHKNCDTNNKPNDYNSKINPLTKEHLEKYLVKLDLLRPPTDSDLKAYNN